MLTVEARSRLGKPVMGRPALNRLPDSFSQSVTPPRPT
jgi:hypothetical protein